MKHWKRNPNQPSTSGVKAPGTYRNVLLRFYPPQASIGIHIKYYSISITEIKIFHFIFIII